MRVALWSGGDTCGLRRVVVLFREEVTLTDYPAALLLTLDQVGDIDGKYREEHHAQRGKKYRKHLADWCDSHNIRTYSSHIHCCPP